MSLFGRRVDVPFAVGWMSLLCSSCVPPDPWACPTSPSCAPRTAQRHGRHADLRAVHPKRAVTTLTALDFLGFGLPAGSPSLGELLAQGKNNVHAPWLGLTGFFTLAVLLTLLIFVGEAARDALDPRRTMKDPLLTQG